MLTLGERSLIVAGNVYFCDFRKAASRRVPHPASGMPPDVQLTAEALQGACRDLMAGVPALLRCAELNAADLVNVASMIDELALQVHIMALESGSAAAPAIGVAELQRLLLDGATVTAEIQSCMRQANAATDQLAHRLREQVGRALLLGQCVAQALDAVGRDEMPASP